MVLDFVESSYSKINQVSPFNGSKKQSFPYSKDKIYRIILVLTLFLPDLSIICFAIPNQNARLLVCLFRCRAHIILYGNYIIKYHINIIYI